MPRWSLAALIAVSSAGAVRAQDEGVEFFERKIRPALIEHCQRCHGTAKPKAHLRLDSRAAMLKGGDTGPALKPGDPAASLLLKAIGYEDPELRMPPRGKLPEDVVADFRRWVEMGAPWPDDAGSSKIAVSKEFDLKARSRHWSLLPLTHPAPPQVTRTDWARSPMDRFILAKLEEHKLTPAPPADPYTLLRRLHYDLIGLPPTPEEIEAFVRDYKASAKPQAVVEQVVDRLLASPHYGERWGRHWLDLVRYAETMGHEFDFEIPDAWRYRDYVVRAFNADVPYNRFVLEHVAGDLLPEPRRHPKDQTNESILGTGFWWLGEAKHAPVDSRADQADRIDNQLDVFGKAFLGLTVACARCHDHKFDAISTTDYYALAGYLQSSRQDRVFLDYSSTRHAALDGLNKIHAEIKAALPEVDVVKPAPLDGAFAHFTKKDWGEWFVAGEAFGSRPTERGDVMIEGQQSFRPLAPGWAHSGRLSPALQGSLRSPTFTIDKRYVHYRVAGKGTKCNVILNGLQLIREPIYGRLTFAIDTETPAWRTQDLDMWRGQRAYIEILDDGPGYAALEQVVFSDQATPPILGSENTPPVKTPADDRLTGLLREFAKHEGALPAPTRGLGIADGNGVDEHVFIRGNSKNLGAVAPRRFLEVFGGDTMAAPRHGSGRLDLAHQMVDPKRTPIVPRVIVNRVWKHHFGDGIVRSPDDFGVLGQPPTHPELLDYLASEFVKNGWSIKKLHKMILLSATYQQDSRLRLRETVEASGAALAGGSAKPQAAAEVDPGNKLLHRMPVRRLEAEAIRDALLAVSGRLDRAVGGPSVPVHLTPFMVGRGRPGVSGPLDGHGRRSLYVSVRRNFLTPMFTAFDYPTPFSTIGRRGVSNVPAQALTMLNNPLVLQQAETWAKRVLAEPMRTPSERVERMYLAGLGRPPSNAETEQAITFTGANDDLRTWTDLAHALFNLKEFIFVR